MTESRSTTSLQEILRPQVILAALALFGLWFVLCRQLSGEWPVNEQYSYSWERWHDFAGDTIVAVVFCGSLLLAALLKRDKNVGSSKKVGSRKPEGDLRPPFLLLSLWLLAVEVGVEAWHRIHERGLIAREQWSARWPETAKDFREINIDETTRRILRFDAVIGQRMSPAGAATPSSQMVLAAPPPPVSRTHRMVGHPVEPASRRGRRGHFPRKLSGLLRRTSFDFQLHGYGLALRRRRGPAVSTPILHPRFPPLPSS